MMNLKQEKRYYSLVRELNEMMDIIVDVGEANGRLASALQIMLDDLRGKKYD